MNRPLETPNIARRRRQSPVTATPVFSVISTCDHLTHVYLLRLPGWMPGAGRGPGGGGR